MFYLVLFKNSRFEPKPSEEITAIHPELQFFKIKLLPPHIIHSDLDFKIEGNNIRFGLLSIKGISDKSIEKLAKFRNAYSNKFEIFQAAEECKLGLGVLSAIIQAGALEGYRESRCRVVLEAQLWYLLTQKEKKWCFQYAEECFWDLLSIIQKMKLLEDEKGKKLWNPKRIDTVRRNFKNYQKIYAKNYKNMLFANWWYEQHLLGYSYEITLREIFKHEYEDLESIIEIQDAQDKSFVNLVCTVEEIRPPRKSKNGNQYVKMTVNDESGRMDVLMFNTEKHRRIDECRELNGSLPEEKSIIYLTGNKNGSVVFINSLQILDKKIYTKLKELKEDNNEEITKEI